MLSFNEWCIRHGRSNDHPDDQTRNREDYRQYMKEFLVYNIYTEGSIHR